MKSAGFIQQQWIEPRFKSRLHIKQHAHFFGVGGVVAASLKFDGKIIR